MLVLSSMCPFSNPLSQASLAQFSKANKWRIPKELSEPAKHTLANKRNEEIVRAGLGHHENAERKLEMDRVRSWRDIEGVMGQYTDLPYPAYLPHHWAEERRHHLNYTECSKYVYVTLFKNFSTMPLQGDNVWKFEERAVLGSLGR